MFELAVVPLLRQTQSPSLLSRVEAPELQTLGLTKFTIFGLLCASPGHICEISACLKQTHVRCARKKSSMVQNLLIGRSISWHACIPTSCARLGLENN